MRTASRRVIALLAVTALVAAACGEAPEDEAAEGAADFRACMITDEGGVDDGSFNETAHEGLVRASEELGITTDVLESASATDYQPNMETFVQQDCDLIVPVGFLLEDVTIDAAQANPDQDFAIVDVFNADELDNVLGLNFQTDEAAFLAGYVAAGTTESGVVGTYGGLPIPPVTIFMDGFLAGIQYYNDEHGTDVQLLGWDGDDGQFTDDFTSLDLGRQVTETLMDNGADIILPVAGPVGGGSAAAMEDRGEGLLIWVDTDGYHSTQWGELMLTSVMKQMDVAVFDAIQAKLDDAFEGGNYFGTLENDGVAIAPFHDHEDSVPQEVRDALADLRQGIIDGDISVEPTT